jgi:hypothetical protein
MFRKNESTRDRAARAVLGSGLLLCSVNRWGLRVGRPLGIVGGLLGMVLLGTAATGTCLIYRLIGADTARAD